jgi:hypothetical protein
MDPLAAGDGWRTGGNLLVMPRPDRFRYGDADLLSNETAPASRRGRNQFSPTLIYVRPSVIASIVA